MAVVIERRIKQTFSTALSTRSLSSASHRLMGPEQAINTIHAPCSLFSFQLRHYFRSDYNNISGNVRSSLKVPRHDGIGKGLREDTQCAPGPSRTGH